MCVVWHTPVNSPPDLVWVCLNNTLIAKSVNFRTHWLLLSTFRERTPSTPIVNINTFKWELPYGIEKSIIAVKTFKDLCKYLHYNNLIKNINIYYFKLLFVHPEKNSQHKYCSKNFNIAVKLQLTCQVYWFQKKLINQLLCLL